MVKRDPANKHKTLLDGEFSMPEFEYLADNEWVFTEKVDGTNIRVHTQGDSGVIFAGRTDNSDIPAKLVAKLNEMFPQGSGLFPEIFGQNADVYLYGEGYGARIQKGGGNYRQDQSFVLFDVKVGDWWLQREDVVDVSRKLGLDVVPIIYYGNLWDMVQYAREGFKSNWGDFQAEGIVARPATELKIRSGHRVITKIKCKDFPVTP